MRFFRRRVWTQGLLVLVAGWVLGQGGMGKGMLHRRPDMASQVHESHSPGSDTQAHQRQYCSGSDVTQDAARQSSNILKLSDPACPEHESPSQQNRRHPIGRCRRCKRFRRAHLGQTLSSYTPGSAPTRPDKSLHQSRPLYQPDKSRSRRMKRLHGNFRPHKNRSSPASKPS